MNLLDNVKEKTLDVRPIFQVFFVYTGVCSSQYVLSDVSAHGRRFLLFLFASALLSGPLANTIENTERAATSLLCGAELAANQTQEMVQRAATPLLCKAVYKEIIDAQFRNKNLDV